MGQTLPYAGPVTVELTVTTAGPTTESQLAAHLLKNGHLLDQVDGRGKVSIRMTDDDLLPGRLHVFRVDVPRF